MIEATDGQRASAVACLLARRSAPPRSGREIIEQVLVKVNGDILTKTEFEQRQVAGAAAAGPSSANVTPDSLELRKAIGEVTPELILDAVDELLLIQRGRELGCALGDEQFNSILDNIKKPNNLEDEAQFQAALKQEGMTMADLRRNLERRCWSSRCSAARSSTRSASPKRKRRRTTRRTSRSSPRRPSSRCARSSIEVPVTDRGVNVAQDDDAKAEAEEIRKRLLSGEPFPRLAAEVSDAPSKANGGLIGPIKRDELAPRCRRCSTR